MRPWNQHRGPSTATEPRKARFPNPIRTLLVLSRKDVVVSIIPGSILYVINTCIYTSLSTTFIDTYNYGELQAGLIYLLFGISAIISTALSGRWIDHDYRAVARAHGLPIKKASGDDLLYLPIEEADMRNIFIPTLITLFAVVMYGWLVDKHIISHHK